MNRFLLIFFLILSNCSFDDKTGIWTNNNKKESSKENNLDGFKTLQTKEKSFNKVIKPKNSFKTIVDPIKNNQIWRDELYNASNNLENFSYRDLNKFIFKSKKLIKSNTHSPFLFDGENFILKDINGDIIVYSINQKKIIFKYNFYNKKFKKIKKILNFYVEDKIIYIADNIGYIYALNYENKKLLWANNFKVPFRSNIKILKNKLFVANQDNNLFIINKFNGERIRLIPTEELILKNNFTNSLAAFQNNLYFLNTYGSLYSINSDTNRINWFINLRISSDTGPNYLFFSNPIIIYDEKVIVSSDPYLYVLDVNTGSTILKTNITSKVKPIISGNNIFLITKDNMLVSFKVNNGNIYYSIKVADEIASFLKTKKKSISIKSLQLVNNELYIFLNNSYVVKFNVNGKINKISKLPFDIKSFPLFINNSMVFLDKKNKLIILD